MGRMSWGHAEKATTKSISARSTTWLPGGEIGSAHASVPSGAQGMFMKRLSGDGVAGAVSPRGQGGVEVVAAVVMVALDPEQPIAGKVAGGHEGVVGAP